MQILIFTSLLSFLGLVAMTANKLWQIKKGATLESHDLHLVGPVAKAAHEHGLRLVERVKVYVEPTVRQAHKDMMLLGYTASASLAKRFAKLANEIKGRGQLPETRSGASFMLAYAQKEATYEN